MPEKIFENDLLVPWDLLGAFRVPNLAPNLTSFGGGVRVEKTKPVKIEGDKINYIMVDFYATFVNILKLGGDFGILATALEQTSVCKCE